MRQTDERARLVMRPAWNGAKVTQSASAVGCLDRRSWKAAITGCQSAQLIPSGDTQRQRWMRTRRVTSVSIASVRRIHVSACRPIVIFSQLLLLAAESTPSQTTYLHVSVMPVWVVASERGHCPTLNFGLSGKYRKYFPRRKIFAQNAKSGVINVYCTKTTDTKQPTVLSSVYLGSSKLLAVTSVA